MATQSNNFVNNFLIRYISWTLEIDVQMHERFIFYHALSTGIFSWIFKNTDKSHFINILYDMKVVYKKIRVRILCARELRRGAKQKKAKEIHSNESATEVSYKSCHKDDYI